MNFLQRIIRYLKIRYASYRIAKLGRAAQQAAEALHRANDAFRGFAQVMDEAYRDACADDPGLEAAVARARWSTHPDVGWLDVAAYRESCRALTKKGSIR